MAAEVRRALIVASDTYDDPGLRQLRAPAADARALARVLRDPAIGGFDVTSVVNRPAYEVNLAVEDFFADRRPNDLLLVHFSCHGVKDEGGDLYFAMTDTRMGRLGATAVAAEFVNRRMARSRSRRVVLLLDCCYAGAFERGMVHRAGSGVGIESQLGGRGRAVVTASSALEYAFEGDVLTDSADVSPSIFTAALVEGLDSGDADRDQDGLVSLDELYDYVYEKVRSATPNQTPGKWTFAVEGELVIARRSRPVTTPSPLPDELRDAITSPLAPVRAVAVEELTRLLGGKHAGLSLGARLALQELTSDDSRVVASAAAAALEAVQDDPHRSTSTRPVPPAGPPSARRGTAPSEQVTAAAKPPERPRRHPIRRWTAIAAGLTTLVAAAAIVTIVMLNRDGATTTISDADKNALLQGIPTSVEEECDAPTTDADGLPTVVCRDGNLSFTLASSEESVIETVGDATGGDECRSSVEPGNHELTTYSLRGHEGTLRCENVGGETYVFTWYDDTTPQVIGRYTLRATFETVHQQWKDIIIAG